MSEGPVVQIPCESILRQDTEPYIAPRGPGKAKCFTSADRLPPSPDGCTRSVRRVEKVRAIKSPAALRDKAPCKWKAEGKSFIFVAAAAAESAGTVTLFRRAECLCIDLADKENGEIFHMLYQGHRGINSLRPASSVLFFSRPRRHRL